MASSIGQRLLAFLRADSAGAVILLVATGAALFWANAFPDGHDAFWHAHIALTVGDASLSMSLQHWVNDAAMALFFFLVTLEVKKDVVLGELRQWRHASLPVLGAVCGLVVPALLFVAITAGTPNVSAWGVVISTDTAFVVGILAAFGRRVPVQLRVFLLALAVVDDIGALVVIALAYTDHLNPVWLIAAAGISAMIWLLRRARARRASVYIALGAVLWFTILQSGVHATIAGVVLALLLPVFPPERSSIDRAEALTQGFRRTPNAEKGVAAAAGILNSVSVNDRFQLSLNRTVALVIVPVFALANAGVQITSQSLQHAFTSTLTWGVIAGLVLGKFVGITASVVFFGKKVKVGELSDALHLRHIASGSLLAGIGFTISLFIVDLAINDPVAQSDARIGILTASLLAAGLAVVSLILTARYDAAHAPARTQLVRPVDPQRDHTSGPDAAAHVIVEYGSFGGVDDLSAEEILTQVVDALEGDVRFVFRHAPPASDAAPQQTAEVLEAVAAQDERLFWLMRHELNRISDLRALDARELLRAAVNVGANLSRVEDDLRRGTRWGRVHDDYVDAEAMGLSLRPALFVNGVIYQGELEPDAIIAELRATQTNDPKTTGTEATTA